MDVLITGAAGNIGQKLCPHLRERHSINPIDKDTGGFNDIEDFDLNEPGERLHQLCTKFDAAIHLAADPNETKTWAELTKPNLDALNHMFMAATEARIPRLIFASSNHTMGRYKEEKRSGSGWLTTELEPKPGTLVTNSSGKTTDSIAYGSMKLFGERLGRMYAQYTGGVFIAVRIGWVNRIGDNRPQDLPENADPWYKQMWLSNRDMCQVFEQCLTVQMPKGSSTIVNAMSRNEGMVWDIEETRRILGYNPQDGLTAKQMGLE